MADSLNSANIINEFFTSVSKTLDDRLPPAQDIDTLYKVNTVFELKPDISVKTITELINSIDLHKSSRCQSISTKIYKDCFLILKDQLTYLLNLSIETKTIRKAWKYLKKKRGGGWDTTNPNNIRPITQTHICGELLEMLKARRLTYYLEQNELSYPGQMGFKKGFSTTLAI